MKWELGFVYYRTRKMEFESLGLETQTEKWTKEIGQH